MKKLFLILLFLFSTSAFAVSDSYRLGTQTAASVTGTSSQVLPENAARGYLIIQNQGTQNVYVKFGSTQASSLVGILLVPGAYYEMQKAIKDSVWMISASGTQTVQVTEGQ